LVDPTVIIVVLIALILIGVPAFVIGRASLKSRQLRLDTEDTPSASLVVPSLGERLASTRATFSARVNGLLARSEMDGSFWSQLEEELIAADVGVKAAADVAARVRSHHPTDAGAAYDALRSELAESFLPGDRHLVPLGPEPIVIIVVGVNGSGKTTTIAKLAQTYQALGASAVLGAADTFRAGASEQLQQWGLELEVPVVGGEPGSDPASVAHDAIATAANMAADVLIVDTAGRLHSDANLMDELGKVVRISRRESTGPVEVLLVLDGTGGQNSIAQAATFTEAVGVTGIAITKLDGTARGGVALAVESELGIPIKLIGVGERSDDLIPFVPGDFVNALLEARDE
jgi:fused signal recognition particle receptor